MHKASCKKNETSTSLNRETLYLEKQRSEQHSTVHNFDFLIEDSSNRVMAEVCASILKQANELSTGDVFYTWLFHQDTETLDKSIKKRSKSTLVLFGDVIQRWILTPGQISDLRFQMMQSQRIILIGSAIFIPNQLGVFNDRVLAVHPNFVTAAHEILIEMGIDQEPFIHSGKIKSAISGIAALSLIIETLSEDLGAFTGAMISAYLGLTKPRNDIPLKTAWKYLKLAEGDLMINQVIKLMCQNIEEPLLIQEIADKVRISSRQMERRIKKITNETASNIYTDLRLEHANQLLLHTEISLYEVGVASGYNAQSVFYKRYKEKYNIHPSAVRNMIYKPLHKGVSQWLAHEI